MKLLRRLVWFIVLGSTILAGCATRTLYVSDGEPVRLRETIHDAKVAAPLTWQLAWMEALAHHSPEMLRRRASQHKQVPFALAAPSSSCSPATRSRCAASTGPRSA